MPKDRYESFSMGEDGKPVLKVHRYDGTGDETYTGDKALAWASNPYAERWRRLNPVLAFNNKLQEGDVRGSIPYRLGTWTKSIADSPDTTFMGGLFDKGMKQGGIAGALMGGIGALGARFLYSKFLGGDTDPNYLLYALLGAAGGGALGAGYSHLRGVAKNNPQPPATPGMDSSYFENAGRLSPPVGKYSYDMTKTASIYRDPRNYILEKIQTARDIGAADKVKLANAVRELDPSSAVMLSKLVREKLGSDIGGTVAKYLYGTTSTGSYMGRIVSLLGNAYMSRVLNCVNAL